MTWQPSSGAGRATSRFESLDVFRGVACLLVIVYHATMVFRFSGVSSASAGAAQAVVWFTSHFNVGVDLFFVISGYCIAAAADNTRRRGGGIGQYFMRRFRRIYPPFWIVVACSFLPFLLFDYRWEMPLLSSAPFEQLRPWWYSPSQWVGNLTLTETWRHYFFGSPRVHFPGQAWTLCYEEQFYFVTGLLLLTLRKRFFAGVAAVSAITLVIATTCAWIGVSVDGFFFDGAWLMFAAGVAVYYRLHHASTSGARAIDMLLVTAVLASSLSPYRLHCSPFGFAFAAGLPWRYRFDRLSSASLLRPVLSCGRMCYSLYLVHQIPVKGLTMALYLAGFTSATATLFLAVPLSIGLSVALGWVFFELVERRFLNTPATTVPMPTAPVGALLSAGG